MTSIKSTFRKSFIGKLLISELHCFECWLLPRLIPDEKAIKKYYRSVTGKELNLDSPQSFCEKINWYKLSVRDPKMEICADKYSVREYVVSKGYSDRLNELYGVYNSVSEINLEKLPDRFVLKAAHGSHMNVIVRDKNEVCWWKQKILLRSWLRQNIYWSGREWAYKNIPHRIIAEKYLEDEFGELRDYKFFCYHGVPEYMEYDIGRFTDSQYRNYYDMSLKLLPINDGVPNLQTSCLTLLPEEFDEMKKMASKLSEDFDFVRVDFYIVNRKIYFGEMTFYDGGGSTLFAPEEWNYKFSEKWMVRKHPVVM